MSLAQLRKPKMTDTPPLFSERLTAEEEKQMAREIRKAEQDAREAVAGIDEADSILMRRPDRAERTRAGAVDRLEEAVKATIKASRKEPELKEYAQIAARSWNQLPCWRLQLHRSGRDQGRRRHASRDECRHRSSRRLRPGIRLLDRAEAGHADAAPDARRHSAHDKPNRQGVHEHPGGRARRRRHQMLDSGQHCRPREPERPHPGVGLLEFTNLSVGRGTATPFELVGAPYIDPTRFSLALNRFNLPGLEFMPATFTPSSSLFQGSICGGVRIVLRNQSANTVDLGIVIGLTLRKLYPDKWQPTNLDKLLVHPPTAKAILTEKSLGEIKSLWLSDLAAFAKRRSRALIY